MHARSGRSKEIDTSYYCRKVNDYDKDAVNCNAIPEDMFVMLKNEVQYSDVTQITKRGRPG